MQRLLAILIFFLASAAISQDGEARLDTFFERTDSNHDAKISAAELEAVGQRSAWLNRADTDEDGLASREEVLAFFGRRSEPPSKEGKERAEINVIRTESIPENSEVSLAGIEAAEAYSAAEEGHSFFVMIGGEVVRESYAGDWDRSKGHRLASGTKSFSGAILALGVKDGLLQPEERVSETIEEWKQNEALRDITIRDLLNLTSGIDPGDNGRVPPYATATQVKSLGAVGEKFRYGPNAFQIFGELVTRKLAAREDLPFPDPLAYLEARIFEPIGLHVSEWRRDRDGKPHLPSGAFLTTPEWAKYGQLLLEDGVWEGETLLDKATLAEATRTISAVMPGYGLTFWLLDGNGAETRPWLQGGYMAAGAGKQRLFVLPAAELVVVRQGESRNFDNLEFLEALFSIEEGVDSSNVQE